MTPLFGFAVCSDQVKTHLCPFTAISRLDKSNALLHVTLRLLESPGIGAQYPFLTLIISIFKTANPRDVSPWPIERAQVCLVHTDVLTYIVATQEILVDGCTLWLFPQLYLYTPNLLCRDG